MHVAILHIAAIPCSNNRNNIMLDEIDFLTQ